MLTINRLQQSNSSIAFNQKFLTKILGEIFSEKISARFTNFLHDHNKRIIQQLKNEEDEEKKLYFNKLFDLTFIQCLNHFMEKDNITELYGLKTFKEIKNDIINSYSDGYKYIIALEYYLNNYEVIINNKKPREKSKKYEKDNKIQKII